MSAAVIDERSAAPRVIPDGQIPGVPIVRLSVADYHRMLDAGILQSGDPIELLAGWLVPKMTKGPRHGTVLRLIAKWLEASAGPGWIIRQQDPITTDDSEPEPDIAVVAGQDMDYLRRHPHPNEVALVIEVAHTSVSLDRGLKAEIYAHAGIEQYWVANLVDDVMEVYSQPNRGSQPPRYERRVDYHMSDSIPVMIRGRRIGELAVETVLPH
jgi:Uma2 family endonuclease